MTISRLNEWGALLNQSSIYDLEEGQVAWMVMHNDNSDCGECRVFFETSDDARTYAEQQQRLFESGETGNEQHPAPENLNLRLYRVEFLVGGWRTPSW